MGVTGPAYRLDADELQRISKLLREAAAQASSRLGYLAAGNGGTTPPAEPSYAHGVSTQPAVAPLVVRTVELTGGDDDARSLLDLVPLESPLAWVRDDDGLIGWGEVARFDATGPVRFAAAEAWWKDLVAGAVVRDEVGLPGTGPVAFGSFGFDATPGDSVLVVPQPLVGQRAGRRWVTTITAAGDPPHQPIASVRQPVD